MTAFRTAAVGLLLLLTGACGRPVEPAKSAPVAAAIAAPAGRYVIDPEHSTLFFRIRHIGLGDYVARFRTIDSTVTLDTGNPAASSVIATIDPTSLGADFRENWKAVMPASPYSGWEQYLSLDPQFLNARVHKTITFRSTAITVTGPSTAKINGDLTLLGQTRPVSLDATLTGSTAAYPMGGGAIGVKATGSFRRSDFGMTAFLTQPGLGDEISLEFNGEYREAKPTKWAASRGAQDALARPARHLAASMPRRN